MIGLKLIAAIILCSLAISSDKNIVQEHRLTYSQKDGIDESCNFGLNWDEVILTVKIVNKVKGDLRDFTRDDFTGAFDKFLNIFEGGIRLKAALRAVFNELHAIAYVQELIKRSITIYEDGLEQSMYTFKSMKNKNTSKNRAVYEMGFIIDKLPYKVDRHKIRIVPKKYLAEKISVTYSVSGYIKR